MAILSRKNGGSRRNKDEGGEASGGQKPQDFIENAVEEAPKIIRDSLELSSQAKQDLEARLLAASQAVEEETKRSIDQIFVQHSQIVKRISDELTVESKHQMERLREELEAGVAEHLAKASGEITARADDINASLQVYAQQEKDRLRAGLMSRIPKIIERLIGRSLSIEDHEKMIDDALDRAIEDLT